MKQLSDLYNLITLIIWASCIIESSTGELLYTIPILMMWLGGSFVVSAIIEYHLYKKNNLK